jgi:hypothetical protein
VESTHAFWGFFSPPGSQGATFFTQGGTTFNITQKLFNAHGTDPRIVHYLDGNSRRYLKYGKPGETEYTTGFWPGSSNNVRILRYADLKLLAAEALIKSGGSTVAAIGHINDVRTRARTWGTTLGVGTGPENYSTGEANPTTIKQWIRNERFVELAGEEAHRWFDLKRWDAAGDISLSSGFDFSSDLSSIFNFEYPKHLLYPIPQQEIDRNSAINMNNPGY